MKYKIGQRVRIISKPPIKTSILNWNHLEMTKMCGKVFTIDKERGIWDGLPVYGIVPKGRHDFFWKEDWLLPLSDFQIEDTVRILVGTHKGEKGLIYAYDGDHVMVDIQHMAVPFLDNQLELISRKRLI
jgi:hypothetical protein